MNGILIFIAIVVISSTIGAVSRWLKNQQQEEQARLARERSGNRAARPEVRTGTDTIDRYVAEIERLRQRKAGGAAPAQRAPTPPVVKPVVRKARVVDGTPAVAKPTQRARAAPPRVEDLPVAPVVSRPPPPPVVTPGGSLFPQPGDLTTRPEITAEKLTQVPPFLALLSSPKGLATAMAISIVLGPPRCKQHHV